LGERIEPEQVGWYVDVIGSRMGLQSGKWHMDFLDFLSTYYPQLAVRFYDPYELPGAGTHKGIRFEHFRKEYPGPSKTLVQIDDSQAGPVHVAPDWSRSPYFSEKKRGPHCFGIRESRYFSHVVPSKFTRSYSTCKCLRCKATSYIADVYGGWPVYERVRAMLAKLGGVCEQSSALGLLQTIEEAREEYQARGVPIPEAYQPFVSLCEVAEPVQEFIRGKSGIVLAYLNEFEGSVFKRSQPYDFVVADSTRPFQEIGCPEFVLTKSSQPFAGYEVDCHCGEYVVLKRCVEEVVVSWDLKL